VPAPFAAAFLEASGNPESFRDPVQHTHGAGGVMPEQEHSVAAGKTPLRSLSTV